MATGENRVKKTINGKTYWYNPNTGKYFTSKTGGKAVTPAKPKLPGPSTTTTGTTGKTTGGTTTGTPQGTGGTPTTTGQTGTGGSTGKPTTPDPTKKDGIDTGFGDPDHVFDWTVTPEGQAEWDRVSGEQTPKPTTTLPPGFEWFWNGTTWIPQAIEGYQPPMPTEAPPAGMEWYWTGTAWSVRQTAESTAATEAQKASLLAQMEDFLETYGLNTPGLMSFLQTAIANGWDATRIKLEIRKHPDYLANPLYAANLERTKNGGRFMSEGELKAYGDQAKNIAGRFGYEVSDNYIAMGLLGGLSNAEFEHRLAVQDRVNQYGAGVALVYRQLMGTDPTDEDLYEIFDPERSTDDFDNMAREAEMRGRPFTLGLGIRSEAEARALEMLGVNPDEAFSRYQGVAANASRFARLGAIESMIAEGLPEDFGSQLGTQDNSLLIRGLVFQDQEALAQLQNFAAREVARFQSGGGAAFQGTRATGLMTNAQRQAG